VGAGRWELEKLISLEPLPGTVTASMDVYLWREFERVDEPTDAEEVGRVEWVPLAQVTELAARGELLGSGTLVALLNFPASRVGAPAGRKHEANEAS